MVRRSDERKIDDFEKRCGGEGILHVEHYAVTEADLAGKGSMLAMNVLKPGCSIGYHVHTADTEIYMVLKGEAEYSDNGTLTTLKPGDSSFCPKGEGHSIKAIGDQDLEFIALKLYC